MNRAKKVNRLFLAMILISMISPFILGNFFSSLTFYQSSAVSEAMFLLPVLCYILMTGGECLNDLQLQIPRISVLFLVIVFAWMMLPLMTWMNVFSMLFAENYVASELLGLDGAAMGKNLFYIAVVPALAEEFMFRGIFYHGYRFAGIGKAIVFSGLCFGLLHMNLNQFFYAFVIGMIFALLVEATGSLISSMLAHFVINSNSVMLLAVQSELAKELGTAAEGLVPEAAQGTAEVLSRREIWSMMGYYTVQALICCVLAYGVLRLIIRLSGRREYMQQALGGRYRSRNADRQGEEEEGRQHTGRQGEEKVVTPALFLGILCAVFYMVFTEFFL